MNYVTVYLDDYLGSQAPFGDEDVTSLTYPEGVKWEVFRGVLTIFNQSGQPLVAFSTGEWSRVEFTNVKVITGTAGNTRSEDEAPGT